MLPKMNAELLVPSLTVNAIGVVFFSDGWCKNFFETWIPCYV
jgi:hypothetical protein